MKVLIAGDFCPQYGVAEALDKEEFNDVLGEVKPVFESSDYSLINFECAVANESTRPICKYGPNLRCSGNAVKALRWLGGSGVTLANNHFYDYGEEGVDLTLRCCIDNGLDYVGGGKNIDEASKILYKDVKGKRIAFINCCEHEFSIATEITGGSNPLNPIQQYYTIKEARQNADYIIMIIHGGHEHYPLPSPRMQETYRFFVDAGADIVINHHQHCFSGYEIYKESPIIYGLGNFCFEENCEMMTSWYDGLVCIINIEERLTFELIPYVQCKDDHSIHIIEEPHAALNMINEFNGIIADKELLNDSYYDFLKQNNTTYLNAIEPYGRVLMRLYRDGYIKSGLTKSRLLKIFNLISCESHLDKMRDAINRKIKEL